MHGTASGRGIRAAACAVAIILTSSAGRAEIVLRGDAWDEVFTGSTGARPASAAGGQRSLFLDGAGAAGEFFIRTSVGAPDLARGRTVRIVARMVGVVYSAVIVRNLSLPGAPGVGFLLAGLDDSKAWSEDGVEGSLPTVPRGWAPQDPYQAASLATRELLLRLGEGENRIRVEVADPREFCAKIEGEWEGDCAPPVGGSHVQIFEIAFAPGDARPLGTIVRLPRPVMETESTGGRPPFLASFDGSASAAPDGRIASLSWDFDDRDGIGIDAEGPAADCLFRESGRFVVTLTATDDKGHANRAQTTILVHEAPRISPISPDAMVTYAGIRYAWRLPLTAGIPDPEWIMLSGPPGLTVGQDGWVEGWIPSEDDVGQVAFPMHVRAMNALGQHTMSWSTAVAAGLADKFDVDPRWGGTGWNWRPSGGALTVSRGIERIDGNSAFVVRMPREAAPGVAFDHGYGFDLVPRLWRADMGSGSFQIETDVRLLEVAGDGEAGAGLVVELDRPDRPDLLIYGLAGAGGAVRFERTADRSLRSGALNLGAPQASLRIQRDAGVYRFLTRRGSERPWILQSKLSLPEPRVRAVGVFVRNRGREAPSIVAAFDDFKLRALPFEPPTVWLCTGFDRAWIGEEYMQEVIATTAIPNTPYKLNVAEGPPGLRVSPEGSVYGWIPGPWDEGHIENVEIQASSAGGSVTKRWRVAVGRRGAPMESFDRDPFASGVWSVRSSAPVRSVRWLGEGKGVRLTLGEAGTGTDAIPVLSFTRRDMGAGDFTIETKLGWPFLLLADVGAGLVVSFGDSDRVFWGPWGANQLAAVWGRGVEFIVPIELRGPTGFRIRKDCGRFSFDYCHPNESWVRAGGVEIWKPVESVGVFLARPRTGAGDRTADFLRFDIPGRDWTGRFRRGDVDGGGSVSIGDAIRIVMLIFEDGDPPDCFDAADVNDDGSITIGDAITLLQYIFDNGRAPSPPGPNACGEDPTADGWPPDRCKFHCP